MVKCQEDFIIFIFIVHRRGTKTINMVLLKLWVWEKNRLQKKRSLHAVSLQRNQPDLCLTIVFTLWTCHCWT